MDHNRSGFDNNINQGEERIMYSCMHCSSTTELGTGDAIRCKHCGKNILTKMRDTTKSVQFFAI